MAVARIGTFADEKNKNYYYRQYFIIRMQRKKEEKKKFEFYFDLFYFISGKTTFLRAREPPPV